MLVLSRKQGESLVIAGTITVRVLQVQGDKVRLGVEAPREVSIHRSEVYQRILAEADLASKTCRSMPN